VSSTNQNSYSSSSRRRFVVMTSSAAAAATHHRATGPISPNDYYAASRAYHQNAAYCYRQSSVVCVSLSVCLLVAIVSSTKTDEPIKMPLAGWTRGGSTTNHPVTPDVDMAARPIHRAILSNLC